MNNGNVVKISFKLHINVSLNQNIEIFIHFPQNLITVFTMYILMYLLYYQRHLKYHQKMELFETNFCTKQNKKT